MQILIFSDSHGDVETMCTVVRKENPDVIIHLGDHITDADTLSEKYPDIKMYKVLGNTDSQKEDEQWIQYAQICGKSFMLTHGHTFLEQATTYIEGQAKMFRTYAGSVDFIVHGHTHEPFLHCCDGKWIMNPGRIGKSHRQNNTPIYGVLEVKATGALAWRFVQVE